MLNYNRFECNDALRPYVRYFWELYYNSDQPYTHLQLPDACSELLFNLAGDFDEISHDGKLRRVFRACLQCSGDQPKRFHVSSTFRLFGAYMYPYTATTLFGRSAGELRNTRVDLHTLLGSQGRELENRILDAVSTSSRIAILSDFMMRQIYIRNSELYNMDAAIREINFNRGNFSVTNLAVGLNTSVRQLERRFKAVSGFGPKEYGKIVRFRYAIEVLNKSTSLADAALELGYYDQAHFSKEFKAISGFTPNEFIRNSGNEKVVYTD
jgi:AraC-like DNA-binding protein